MPVLARRLPVRRLRGRHRVLVVALAIALGAAGAVPAGPAAAQEPGVALRAGCLGPANSIAIADDLLENRYTLSPHRTVELPADPTWAEQPIADPNWAFQLHSLRFVWALTTAWSWTGDQRYLDRASFLLADWRRDNPRSGAPSRWAWDGHATAWRAMVFACASEILPASSWMQEALLLHGRTLADPAFYAGRANHALNQDIGLLEVGARLARMDWKSLAARRLDALVVQSVDASGATNEQAVAYQLYNYDRYSYARQRLVETGMPVGDGFARIDLMPTFLAHATLPNGRYVPLGDTETDLARAIPGTTAEFAATNGASGPRPTSTSRVYGAGFTFVRTGWGDDRPFVDETMMTVRHGPARYAHGHEDGTSITLYAYGDSVLLDSGKYTYEPGPDRLYFVRRSAHNLVTVDGAKRTASSTAVRWKRSSPTMLELMMSTSPYSGVRAERRVTFSRTSGFAVVDDRLTATSRRTFRQLWHLREGTSPVISGSRAWTRAARSNVLIVQVLAPAATRIVTGATSPVQGWVSYSYGKKVAAPVVESRRSGTSARFLTLLVPYATTRPRVTVTELRLTSTGYAMTVTIGSRRERVVAGVASSRVTPLP
jgi:hypothetical protein